MRLCKGLNQPLCDICARQDDQATEALAESLSIDSDDNTEYCNHFL